MAWAAPAAIGQEEQRLAAILMVHDNGNQAAERLGVAVFQPFLARAPYREVHVLQGPQDGNERLARTIRDVATRHDAIDVILSVHTTTRDPEAWARLIPPAARKLRLVYSTACSGSDHERRAWERVGARTVVTHAGLNNPVVALPYFLSCWIAGEPVGPTVARGYTETSLVTRFGLSLPGGAALLASAGGAAELVHDSLAGSRPVLSGDTQLRIHSGLRHFRPTLPRALAYERARGGSLGLALRAASGRYTVRGAEVLGSVADMGMPLAFLNLDVAAFDRATIADDRLNLFLSREVRTPLDDGFVLTVSKKSSVRPGALDPVARTLALDLTGVWVQRGLLRVRVSRVSILPAADGDGYRLRVGGGAWGVIPIRRTLPIGGTRPAPIPGGGPIVVRAPLVPSDTPGIVNSLR